MKWKQLFAQSFVLEMIVIAIDLYRGKCDQFVLKCEIQDQVVIVSITLDYEF